MRHFLLSYDVAPDYLARRGEHREAHLRLAWEAVERGELLLGGAYDDASGALLLFTSRDAAERFAAADPYVVNDLVSRWAVREWLTVVGEGAASVVR